MEENLLLRVTTAFLLALAAWFVAAARRYDSDVLPPSEQNNRSLCLELQHAFPSTRIVCPTNNRTVYDTERQQFIESFDHFPQAIVYPAGQQALSDMLRYVVAYPCLPAECPVAVRNGGHDNLGRSTATGAIVMDLSLMNHVVLHEGDDPYRHPIVSVGGGAKFADVVKVLSADPNGYVFALGDCSSVGVTGYALNGGLSVLTHALGLGVDQIDAVEAVLVNGTVVRASKQSGDPRIFAALRGAAPHMAVVTQLNLSLTTVPHFLLFRQNVTVDRLEACLGAAAAFTEEYPGWASVYTAFGTSGLRLLVSAADSKDGRVAAALRDVFVKRWKCPLDTYNLQEQEQNDSAETTRRRRRFWDTYKALVSVDAGKSFKNYSSQLRNKIFSQDELEAFSLGARLLVERFGAQFQQVQADGMPTVDVDFIVTTVAGAMNKVPLASTAWGHRDAKLVLAASCTAFRKVDNEAHCMPWSADAFSLLRRFGNLGGAEAVYPNDANWMVNGNHLEAYFGRNLPWLQQVKDELDPCNRLSPAQGIRSTACSAPVP